MDRIRFSDPESRKLLALLRFSGMSQSKVSSVLRVNKMLISIEESEPRYKETVSELVAKLAKQELPEAFWHLFEETEEDNDEPAIHRIQRRLSEQ